MLMEVQLSSSAKTFEWQTHFHYLSDLSFINSFTIIKVVVSRRIRKNPAEVDKVVDYFFVGRAS